MFQEIGERISMELQVQWLGRPRWCCLHSSAVYLPTDGQVCSEERLEQMVQLLCTIGVGKLVSLVVHTNGAEQGSLKPNDVTIVLEIELDCVQIRSYCRLAGFARAWASADGGVLAFRT